MMRALDKRAMEEYGIPGAVLMENAGRAVFEHIAARYSPLAGRRFVVWCGTGNNGGDGFVAARYLHLAGAQVSVHLAGGADKIAGDARTHFETMRRIGLIPPDGKPGPGIAGDALLGTGISGAPRGP